MRLIDHLKSLGLGNKDAREALSTGKVWLRGAPVGDPGREVDPAEIRVRPESPRIQMGRDPVVLFHDRELLVVVKPSGMLSVPAPGREEEPNVLSVLGRRFGSVYPVHRLDEETSGLMMVALRPESQEALKAQLEEHRVERRYLALVRGGFGREGTICTAMIRDRGDGLRGSMPDTRRWLRPGEGVPREAPPRGARWAVTHLRCVETTPALAIVEARLETGRTHQVRIHLAETGHPVLGDGLYGPERVRRDRRGGRLALHAWQLRFTHPTTRVEMAFEAPLADDLDQRWREAKAEAAAPKAAELGAGATRPVPRRPHAPGPRGGKGSGGAERRRDASNTPMRPRDRAQDERPGGRDADNASAPRAGRRGGSSGGRGR
jgi:23S rRNA pseudouridine1911/1915/1917 synthase